MADQFQYNTNAQNWEIIKNLAKTFGNNPRNKETVDAMLGVTGVLPVVGDVQSGAMAAKDIKQGNYGSGALNALGALPLIPALGGVLAPSKYVGETLKGMPNVVDVDGSKQLFGTDQRIVDLAKQYAADKGLLYTPQTEYAVVDPERARRIAAAYESMSNNPSDPKVKKAYDALVKETQDQYETLRKAGYKIEFNPSGVDPYGNPRNAINDIVTNKHLYVFPTESGFGTINEASAANPLLQKTGEYWNGKPVTANDMFRAVHDVFGHAKHGVGFRAGGEENTWQAHARMYSPEARPAATTETRGQNSWLNFGKYGEKNRTAKTQDTVFADQKTGLLPDWVWLEGLLK